MRLLLDTHFLIELIDRNLTPERDPAHAAMVANGTAIFASVASLWEVAIKSRLGKLPIRVPVKEWPALLESLDVPLLAIEGNHVLAPLSVEPKTNDPFDRLLLGACVAEGLELITRDRGLVEHPLSWRVPLVKK